ncbi:hypothetical protein STEG23_021027, partial [Scotinomys teguina]
MAAKSGKLDENHLQTQATTDIPSHLRCDSSTAGPLKAQTQTPATNLSLPASQIFKMPPSRHLSVPDLIDRAAATDCKRPSSPGLLTLDKAIKAPCLRLTHPGLEIENPGAGTYRYGDLEDETLTHNRR